MYESKIYDLKGLLDWNKSKDRTASVQVSHSFTDFFLVHVRPPAYGHLQ